MNGYSKLRVGLVALMLGLLGACSETAEEAATLGDEQVLRRGNVEEPETLDPLLADDVHAFDILADLYEGLVAENAKGELVGGVAESWTISEDGLRYEFRLREDARWSNGETVTATHFVNALRRLASPDTLSTYAFLFHSIQNFRAIQNDEAAASELGATALSATTLLIELTEPNPYFLRVLALPSASPQYAPVIDTSHFQRPDTFIGNGAYVLAERSIGRPIRLERNPHYWDAAAVSIPAVEYYAIDDPLAELNLYRAGTLHVTASIPTSHFQNVVKSFGEEVRVAPSLGLYYLAFDLTEAPLDDRDLRQALSMAIDRQQLTQLVGRGEQPAYSVVPPGTANYAATSRYDWRDLDAASRVNLAREALARSGYVESNAGPLKLTYDTGSVHEKIAVTVAAMWRETLGLEVELEKKEWKHFLDTRARRSEWQIMRFSWLGDYNDPSTFMDIFESENAQNLSRFDDAEYDELLTRAAVETDLDTRAEIIAAAEQQLLDQYPIAPLYFYVSKHLVKPTIVGFEHSVINRHPSKYLAFR